MLVIVIGAGASFDSLGPRYLPLAELANPGWRPPLTAGLFEPRADTFGNVISQFPDVRPLIIQLADAVDAGEQVEDAIQRIAAASAGSDRGSRQLAALQFYLQEVLWRAGITWAAGAYGLTNYVQLVDAVERWRSQRRELVAYVTFNYDLMLEEALGPLVDRTSFDGYMAESPGCSRCTALSTGVVACRWGPPTSTVTTEQCSLTALLSIQPFLGHGGSSRLTSVPNRGNPLVGRSCSYTPRSHCQHAPRAVSSCLRGTLRCSNAR